jgi:SAM-dependent methyltransferase
MEIFFSLQIYPEKSVKINNMSHKKETQEIWNKHYSKDKSILRIPDENVVRYFTRFKNTTNDKDIHKMKILDLGCGVGRNGIFLLELGFDVYFMDYAAKSIRILESLLRKKNLHDSFFSDDRLTAGDAAKLPFTDNMFNFVLAWGVLHYNSTDEIRLIIEEIKRCMVPDGIFFGSIRATNDTHLKVEAGRAGGSGIRGSTINLFSLDTIKLVFNDFKHLKTGYMERTELGNLEERICHWIVEAGKF